MALWMTVEQECFGLAALLLVFSCAFWCGDFHVRGRGKDKGRQLAFFVAWTGLILGTGRMEYEEWRIEKEQSVLETIAGQEVWVTGQVVEIQKAEYGTRLQIRDCEVFLDFEGADDVPNVDGVPHVDDIRNEEIRRLYLYTDFEADVTSARLGLQIAASGTCELPERDRNPGGFDYRLYCFSKGVCGIFYADTIAPAVEGSIIPEVENRAETLYWRIREGIRQIGLRLERQLEQITEEEDRGILKAILLGQKTDLGDDVYELYRRNGISHVLAISGLHVSVIGMGLWKCLRKLGFGYSGAGGLAFGIVFAYGMMTGFGPSVVRAVFMMGVSFLAGMFGRTYDLPSAMCVPALGLLLRRPYLLTQASFQLSFLAVGAMYVPGTYLVKRWGLNGIAQKVWISASLQVMTLPVVLVHSFEVPLFGIILNLIVVPLMSYVLVSGILGLTGSFLGDGFGIFMLGGAHCILWLYENLCLGIQQIPGSNVILGSPEWIKIILYYGLVLLGTWLAGAKGKHWLILWGVGSVLLVPWPKQGLSVTFLDVGQGDGIYLEAEGKSMLVDCGSSQEESVGENVLIPFLKSRGIRHLDAVVISHSDLDHVSGIRDLLEDTECGISIGNMILPMAARTDEVSQELVTQAWERGVEVGYCGAGDSLTGILGQDIDMRCLHPDKDVLGEDRNENSLVLLVSYQNFSMMLTGDIGQDVERELMERYALSPVTVLKAAHHGSAQSSSREFLEKVRPAYVVFSYGEGNSYGHPAPQAVENCREIGAEVYETARSGALRFWTDGKYLHIDGWLDRQGGI